MDNPKSLIVFEDKNIRRIWHNDQWYFSIVDVVGVLTDSMDPRNYLNLILINLQKRC